MLDLLTPTWTAWIGLMGKDMPGLLGLDDPGWGDTQGKLPFNRERRNFRIMAFEDIIKHTTLAVGQAL